MLTLTQFIVAFSKTWILAFITICANIHYQTVAGY